MVSLSSSTWSTTVRAKCVLETDLGRFGSDIVTIIEKERKKVRIRYAQHRKRYTTVNQQLKICMYQSNESAFFSKHVELVTAKSYILCRSEHGGLS